jgi:hypothetical protein
MTRRRDQGTVIVSGLVAKARHLCTMKFSRQNWEVGAARAVPTRPKILCNNTDPESCLRQLDKGVNKDLADGFRSRKRYLLERCDSLQYEEFSIRMLEESGGIIRGSCQTRGVIGLRLHSSAWTSPPQLRYRAGFLRVAWWNIDIVYVIVLNGDAKYHR